jgi:hypothetical protein
MLVDVANGADLCMQYISTWCKNSWNGLTTSHAKDLSLEFVEHWIVDIWKVYYLEFKF